LISGDVNLAIITDKDAEGIDLIRHSTAHLLAYAVKELFPEAQVTIGPVIENGFFYDFAYSRPFTPEDLTAIEKRMLELAKKDLPVTRKVLPRDEAVAYFKSIGEAYKAEIIESIPADQDVSLYSEGEFTDLCRGPHVPSTGKLKAFKLMKVAGAYWRGDSKNEMLQRIYGTAWAKKEELDTYLMQIEEAEKRDHRKLGKQLDLFHMQDEAPGMVFWHPKGWALWQVIEQYMRHVYRDNGYQEVRCPQIIDRVLWEKSGHWEHFKTGMFTTESEKHEYAIKPMNCPGHIQVFNADLRSYRELPLRYGEFGSCHRNEPSGGLHGLMRVRGFVQDDGHIFCTEGQIESEVTAFNALVLKVYKDFGFNDVTVKLALRPESRVGSDDIWDKAEDALRAALRASGLEWIELPGEGAFYGPKIEFHIKDAIGRSWQCGTIQVDFSMPGRLGAEFVDEDNTRKTPVMLHRAILGSLERFIGMLIENHAGAMPLWLAPVQMVVMNISQGQAEYSTQVTEALRAA
jgi:threonyl-tRNA synthetase